MDLKIQAGLIGEPHDLPEDVPGGLREQWVQNGVDQLRVGRWRVLA